MMAMQAAAAADHHRMIGFDHAEGGAIELSPIACDMRNPTRRTSVTFATIRPPLPGRGDSDDADRRLKPPAPVVRPPGGRQKAHVLTHALATVRDTNAAGVYHSGPPL